MPNCRQETLNLRLQRYQYDFPDRNGDVRGSVAVIQGRPCDYQDENLQCEKRRETQVAPQISGSRSGETLDLGFLVVFADSIQLAWAGFFYNPTASRPDNTTCYLCRSTLDGWEEDDSAIGEHLSFSPHCGWAAIARIEQDIEDGNLAQHNPMDERLLSARKMTFGVNWPHEDKRGWVCKTQKVWTAHLHSHLLAKHPFSR